MYDVTSIQNLKKDVLYFVAKASFEGTLEEERDLIPEKMIEGPEPTFRCCIYKEREIVRQRIRLAEGKAPGAEDDGNIVQVIKSACADCPISSYVVTNNCQNCLGKDCIKACRFGAIEPGHTRSRIDPQKCKECGMCAKACPYNAIAHVSRPCKDSCPVDAISYDEYGVSVIDEEKCIRCGQCAAKCPFGAIGTKTWITNVIADLKAGKKVYAILAPATEGQFGKDITMESWRQAVKKVGFEDLIEAGLGGDMTTCSEAEEWLEAYRNGEKKTTSCCPGFVNMIRKHYPDLADMISTTVSPMCAVSRMIKAKDPDAVTVFVGPCVAKRKEAQRDEAVDFVMTFEEISSIFDAFEINLEIVQPYAMEFSSVREAHGFAQAGGVMGAVKAFLKMEADKINAIQVSDLNKKNIGTLRAYAKSGKAPGQFIEVMACEGGCITGPSTHSGSNNGKRQLVQELAKQKKTY